MYTFDLAIIFQFILQLYLYVYEMMSVQGDGAQGRLPQNMHLLHIGYF